MNKFMVKRLQGIILGVGVCGCLLFAPVVANAASGGDISLPAPQIKEGMPVMQALDIRQSSRSFAETGISASQLSHILWAANGINRPETDGRTNPAALGVRSVEVYAVTEKGIYLYQPKTHALKTVAEGDFRMATTMGQDFVGTAPITLVYVSNADAWQKASHIPPVDKQVQFDSIAAGAMAQSVGLVAASEGLGTCVRGSIDHEAFAKVAHLQKGQTVVIAQTIGVLP